MLSEKAFPPAMTIFTLGHSTHSLDEFVHLLQIYAIRLVVDVRTIPRSRHNPQFNGDTLGEALPRNGIQYLQVKSLGGLRHARADSPNTGWKNASFRGFADYMQTSEFDAAVLQLIDAAHDIVTAIMCAEAVPWRCHRSLIADALTVRGIAVQHILSRTSARVHTVTPMARVEGTRITYPRQPTLL
ncbi:MAG: DUF488 domain-containing protein [Proteobacteria bacterium]|nr:DUF488 domain-containing protein [Pseudomonadota bacterium]